LFLLRFLFVIFILLFILRKIFNVSHTSLDLGNYIWWQWWWRRYCSRLGKQAGDFIQDHWNAFEFMKNVPNELPDIAKDASLAFGTRARVPVRREFATLC